MFYCQTVYLPLLQKLYVKKITLHLALEIPSMQNNNIILQSMLCLQTMLLYPVIN